MLRSMVSRLRNYGETDNSTHQLPPGHWADHSRHSGTEFNMTSSLLGCLTMDRGVVTIRDGLVIANYGGF